MKPNVKVLEYSEKCIAVIGDTKPIKDELKAIGGKFNPYLKHDGLTVAGWVFGLKRRNEVLALIGNEGEQVTPEPVVKPNEPVICSSNEPIIEPQPEPQRDEKTKPFKKDKMPEFKVMVKCSGFVEMERIYTNEAKMLKELAEIRKNYNKQVISIDAPELNERTYASQSLVRFGYNNKGNFNLSDHQKYMEQKGISPLKIEFINLV